MQEKLLTGSTLKENIGLAIGAASMCWHETPKGVFNATQACQIVEELNSYVLNMNKKADSIAKRIEISKNKINSLNKFTGSINVVSDIKWDSNIAQLSFLEKKFDVVDGLIVSEEIKSEEPSYKVNEYGDKHWFVNGKLHREDGPACEYTNGGKEWHIDGKCHRLYGPAVEYTNGSKYWWINGKRHRTDGPAVEYANGTKQWWIDGKLHRTDEPAIEYANGSNWWINGKRHRTDGPAVEYANGTKQWWIDGKLHRTDGPAVEYANGDKYWYIDGIYLTETEFNEKVKLSKEKLHKEKLSISGNIEEQSVCELDNNGSKRWYLNEKLHRLDGPAVEHFNGHKYWYVNNKLHRIDGPAIECGKHKEWYVNNQRHRLNSPAIEFANGTKQWWIDGKLHRTDGPAVEYANGDKAWYVNGELLTYQEFEYHTMFKKL